MHTIQFPIGRTSHTLPVEEHVSCFMACAFQCVKLVQHHKRCAMCSPHQSHISSVQQFTRIALALIQSQCPYCVHPCKKAILHGKFGLWMPRFLHSFITDAFMKSSKNHFYRSSIPILFMYFHSSKTMTQLHHNNRTFKL